MSRAEIYLEDANEDGTGGASIRYVFPGGFQPKSHAHQMAQIIAAKLDELAQQGALTALSPLTSANDEADAQSVAG